VLGLATKGFVGYGGALLLGTHGYLSWQYEIAEEGVTPKPTLPVMPIPDVVFTGDEVWLGHYQGALRAAMAPAEDIGVPKGTPKRTIPRTKPAGAWLGDLQRGLRKAKDG